MEALEGIFSSNSGASSGSYRFGEAPAKACPSSPGGAVDPNIGLFRVQEQERPEAYSGGPGRPLAGPWGGPGARLDPLRVSFLQN